MQTSAFGFSGEALPHRQKRNPISAKVARPATFVARLAKKVAGLATFSATGREKPTLTARMLLCRS